jgi:hypothetical protein
MTALVERPDLSTRTALSKSALGTFDLCQTKSWLSIHDPKPFVPNEKVTFGSAVDAGVEVILKYARMGQPIDLNAATLAAEFVIERDETPVDITEVQAAFASFITQVLPHFDWEFCGLQSHLTAVLEGLGECDGHPDIILGDNSVWDVKTSGRAKEVPSLELGFYALLVEEVDPTRKVPRVGYMNYIRSKRPFWQVVDTPVTDELRRWAYEKSAAYVRARKADTALNSRTETPMNFSMTGSAKFPSLCADCPWSPAMGGPCLVSLNEPTLEIADVA